MASGASPHGPGPPAPASGTRRIGAALATLALCLQLAFAGWFPLALPGEAAADLATQALCLAGGSASGEHAPAPPADHHQAGLCLWHCSLAVAAPPPGVSLNAIFASVFLDFAVSSGVPLPAPQPGMVRARSPPVGA